MSCFKFFVVFGLLLLCLLEPNFAEDAQRPSKGLQGQPLGPPGPQGSPMVLQRSARDQKGALPPGLQRPPAGLQRSLLAGLQKPCPMCLQGSPMGLQKPPLGLQISPMGLQKPPTGLQSGFRFKRGFEMEAGDYRDTATWDKKSQLIPMLKKRFYKLKKPEYPKV